MCDKKESMSLASAEKEPCPVCSGLYDGSDPNPEKYNCFCSSLEDQCPNKGDPSVTGQDEHGDDNLCETSRIFEETVELFKWLDSEPKDCEFSEIETLEAELEYWKIIEKQAKQFTKAAQIIGKRKKMNEGNKQLLAATLSLLPFDVDIVKVTTKVVNYMLAFEPLSKKDPQPYAELKKYMYEIIQDIEVANHICDILKKIKLTF